MRSALRILVLLFACIGGNAHAQIDTLRLSFKALTIDDGLSQGMVSSIAQDKYGFLWFATKDGLDRYDGYTFTSFNHDPQDSTSMAGNAVNALYIDRFDRLWVGTNNGVDLFDPITEHFIHLPIRYPGGNWGPVGSMAFDTHGDLWVSSNKAWVKVTFEKAIAANRPLPAFTQQWHEGSFTFEQLSDGRLWGSMAQAVLRVTPEHDGSDVFDTLPRAPSVDPRYERSHIRFIEDPVRDVTYSIGGGHISVVDRTSKRASIIYTLPLPYEALENNQPVIDRAGDLWIATNSGIYRFDPQKRRMTIVRPMDPRMDKALADLACCVAEGSGTLWFGTSGYGLVKYDPRIERFNKWEDRSIRALVPTASGKVLVGRYWEFLSEFDPVQREYTTAIKSVKDVAAGARLNTWQTGSDMIVEDAFGMYWIAMNDGQLIRYDRNGSGAMQLIEPRLEQGGQEVGTLFPLMLGTGNALWFGGNHALWRCDVRTHVLTPFRWPIPVVNDPYDFTAALHEGPDGFIWAGTMHGLLRLDPRTGDWRHYKSDAKNSRSLATDIIFSICADPDEPTGVLWLGTSGGGLNRFDTRTGEVQRFNTSNGVPNDVVYGVLTDARGHLWMSTNAGLVRFDRNTGAVRNFTVSAGLQSNEFNRYAYGKAANGVLYFGGVNGFNYFDPEQLVENSTASPIQITAVRLINKPMDFRDPASPMRTPAHMATGMNIPHSTNMVTFEFATLEFSSPEIHHYRYKLEGFDPDWISSGTDRTAVYTNLDPGTYTFRVRGDNRDGIWDMKGTSFSLTVLPPWWRTWWAYALYVLAFVGGVFAFIRMRTSNLNRQKELLERTVAERTTELQRKKDEADEQRERAEQSEQVKRQFLANMSHEIRTPMNAIVGMSHALQRDAPIDEELRKAYVDAISGSSEHLLGLVNEILDLSRIEAGKLDLAKAPMSPREIMRDVVGVMRYRAQEKGLLLDADVTDAVPANVLGDATRLNQVLMNLVGNAIKFTENGHVRITMDRAALPDMNVSSAHNETIGLTCSVSDTGIGVAPDRLLCIFDEFTQADPGHTRRYEGSGLGLSICKHLVEMQGGTIKAESDPGRGSRFVFTIPYTLLQAGKPIDAKEPGMRPATPSPALRILLVEDHKLNVMVAQMELKNAFPQSSIAVAGHGQIALDMLQADDYDLILMDVQMPVMDGYEATRRIRELVGEKSRIPILAMTANVMEAEVQQCIAAGMDGFIPKPFKQEELVAAIGKVIGGSEV